MSNWEALDQELAYWRAAGRTAELWWRDDDAADTGPELDRLLALHRQSATPLALAVVPARATPTLAERLAAGHPVTGIQSVASFFVSRIDSKVDDMLPEGAGEAFNAGTGTPRSVNEVIEAIKAATRSDCRPALLSEGSLQGEIDSQFVDASKLREATGWSPQVDFEDGLAEAVLWYREHPGIRPAG